MVAVMNATDDGPWCEKNEMPQAWCAHCREQQPARKPDIRRSRPVGDEVRHRFTARYGGTCAGCGERFGKDDHIGVTLYGEFLCEECC